MSALHAAQLSAADDTNYGYGLFMNTNQFPQAKQPTEIYIKPSADGKSGFVHQYVRAFKKN